MQQSINNTLTLLPFGMSCEIDCHIDLRFAVFCLSPPPFVAIIIKP